MSDEEPTEWSNMKSLHKEQFVESKKPTFDLHTLHPEARRRLQMLGFVTTDANGEPKAALDEEVNAIMLRTIHNEDPNVVADKYMMKHGVYELFKVGCTSL